MNEETVQIPVHVDETTMKEAKALLKWHKKDYFSMSSYVFMFAFQIYYAIHTADAIILCFALYTLAVAFDMIAMIKKYKTNDALIWVLCYELGRLLSKKARKPRKKKEEAQ